MKMVKKKIFFFTEVITKEIKRGYINNFSVHRYNGRCYKSNIERNQYGIMLEKLKNIRPNKLSFEQLEKICKILDGE